MTRLRLWAKERCHALLARYWRWQVFRSEPKAGRHRATRRTP